MVTWYFKIQFKDQTCEVIFFIYQIDYHIHWILSRFLHYIVTWFWHHHILKSKELKNNFIYIYISFYVLDTKKYKKKLEKFYITSSFKKKIQT